MHDPEVVAWSIRSPFPKHERMSERRRVRGVQFSWPFVRFGRHELYFRSVVTAWHREPGGADALTVCKGRWQWHLRHLHLQVHPIGRLRRRLLTRCAWCGGRSRKGDQVNTSMGWEREPSSHWWEGEKGLYHGDCMSIEHAHVTCICALTEGDWPSKDWRGIPHGHCSTCGGHRRMLLASDDTSPYLEATTLLRSIPTGQRSPETTAQVEALWAEHRKATALAEGNPSW